MRLNKLLLALAVLLPLMQLFGCGGGGGGGVPVVPVLVSVTVKPATTTILPGATLQFTATANYSNGTSIDVTGSATWSSSTPTVATVSDESGSKGTATGVSAGSTTITASYNGFSGSAKLSVGSNVMTVSVNTVTTNGGLCSPLTSANYFNKPCVSVTVCAPTDPTNCQTINDILLDTGSFGLRIFKQSSASSLGLPASFTSLLPPVPSGSGSLVGCVQFADGSSLWGPIQRAIVRLGGEPGANIPIQVIDAGFAPSTGTECAVQSLVPYLGPDRTPIEAGFIGILGVGQFPQDCGAACTSTAQNGMYYSCTGSGCTGTNVALVDQVQNPVAALPQDNNGVMVQFPFVPPGGIPATSGTMTLGIGTQADNDPGSPTILPTDDAGEFTTLFNNLTFTGAFLDTGSNADFIPNVAPGILPPCSGANSEWYCPPRITVLSATLVGFGGSPSLPVTFTVNNALSLFGSSNRVFSDIAGTSTFGFDWGMPFHMGRKVLYGIKGRSVPALGATGPFVGF
jgi:hypothetical protein